MQTLKRHLKLNPVSGVFTLLALLPVFMLFGGVHIQLGPTGHLLWSLTPFLMDSSDHALPEAVEPSEQCQPT